MLYLEDYLEMIENLPMEMRERLTEMREMDLEVQNSLDSLEERVKNFFKKCILPNVKSDWKDDTFHKIKQDYYKTLSDADEKVQLANHIHDLVDRHLRKLDQELSKFKMELEADNAGITETLEKRSLELDKPVPLANNQRAEKRKLAPTSSLLNSHSVDKRPTTEVLSNIATEAAKEVIRRSNSTANSPSMSMFNSSTTSSPITYNLGHIGAGSNAAIAAAASQAIAATQQMQQGRRTPSMKASYDLMTRTPASAKETASSLSNPGTPDPVPRSQRSKKQTVKAAALNQSTPAPVMPSQAPPTPVQPVISAPSTPIIELIEDQNTELQIADDWQSDPNEPRYCVCNQVSYGDMVGCDNDDCPIEWFHYGCVGLSQAPKGKWFCPQCTAAMKRRGRR
ncbi:inhibitor of growth protein 3-like [Gigantopelta aegis]|uniref:inhibitor of growth protein 3-like n=1 Tax=Gigantopelta aegis TaxID=1735272 RepID=UPI001B88A290|nr:inhibitor of growth protein 3-like [Gigantopelta aegis]